VEGEGCDKWSGMPHEAFDAATAAIYFPARKPRVDFIRQPTVNCRPSVRRASNGLAIRALNFNFGLQDCDAPTDSAARRGRPVPVRNLPSTPWDLGSV
jgi:hypothetical protein